MTRSRTLACPLSLNSSEDCCTSSVPEVAYPRGHLLIKAVSCLSVSPTCICTCAHVRRWEALVRPQALSPAGDIVTCLAGDVRLKTCRAALSSPIALGSSLPQRRHDLALYSDRSGVTTGSPVRLLSFPLPSAHHG